MTNAEKFTEVFGTDLKRQYSTKTWWNQEFVPNKSEIPTGWIPANQPPKASGRYIVTRHFFNDDFIEMASYATDLHKVDKYDFPKRKAGWYNYDSEYGHYEVDDIVAWMPIEPYKASPTGAERSDKE